MVRWVHAGWHVRITASGQVSAREQYAAIRSAATEPLEAIAGRMLYDGRDVTPGAPVPSAPALLRYAQRIAVLGYRRLALVVCSERADVTSILAHNLAALGIEARVFVDLEPATAWLDGGGRPAA